MGHRTETSIAGSETVIGVLIPHGWDEDFSVTSVSLACDGEREIVIDNLSRHPGLLALLRKRLRVTGSVVRSGQGESMDVNTYHPLGDDAKDLEHKGTTDENDF
jgi:transcriptional accessory protein Tex/SPT6